MKKVHVQVKASLLVGATLYALADKSDPFAYNRAMSHINNGVASYDQSYEAEAQMETRKLPDGTEYHVTTYKNLKRP